MRRDKPMRALDRAGTALLAAAALAFGIGEFLRPLRRRVAGRVQRWPTNGALGTIAAAIERGLVVTALALTARRTEQRGWGSSRRLPLTAAGRASFELLALDLGMYVWHRMSHQLPVLWRFHAVHHTDIDLDMTTAARLHPGELLLSIAARAAQIRLIGASERVVLAYEGVMQIASLFYHADLDLGAAADRAAAGLLMTPRLHTRHHAASTTERDCNWGVVLSVWDRMFGSFEDRPACDPRIGTEHERDLQALHLRRLLALPAAGRTVGGSVPHDGNRTA